MALLDFIKNRDGQRPAGEQQSQQQQPETYKQQMTREAEQAKQGPSLQDKMPPEQLSKAAEAKSISITDGQDVPSGNVAPSPSPSGGSTNPQPMRQMSMQQDNPAPAQSPTTAQMGASAPDHDPGSPAPLDTPKPTLPRPTPSWER